MSHTLGCPGRGGVDAAERGRKSIYVGGVAEE